MAKEPEQYDEGSAAPIRGRAQRRLEYAPQAAEGKAEGEEIETEEEARQRPDFLIDGGTMSKNRFVRWIARILDVPIEVRQTLFKKGIKSKMLESSDFPISRAVL
jgi:hypothetical protein